jgi:tetratricopeptide (TPR) repeat protein
MKMGILKFFCLAMILISASENILAIDVTNEWKEAASAYQRNDFESAILHFNQILVVEAQNPRALMNRGACYLVLNKYEDAQRDLNAAVELSTSNSLYAQALLRRGVFFEKTTNIEKAVEDYSRAIQYNPSFASAYAARADLEVKTDKDEDALQDCNMAITLNPYLANAYEIRGRLFSTMEKYDKAIADYNKAINLVTNSVWYYFSRGCTYGRLGDNASAVADFDLALKLAPTNYPLLADIFGGRGLCLSRLGLFEKGIEDCKKGVKINPNSETAVNDFAWLLSTAPDAGLRDGKLAVEYAKHACELGNWESAYDIRTLAAAYAEVGNFDDAVKWAKKCISIGLPTAENEIAQKELDLFEKKEPYHAKK